LVTDGNKKLAVPVAAIYCFTANPPYINIHLADKKFLQHTTLKSMAAQLNPEEFIRVHKSAIVNINRVASYKTRLNGDYDLLLKNGTEIRLSRNFAAGFKALYAKNHQLTTK
jgi:DNA-binding LytR/AlgR family response regulator